MQKTVEYVAGFAFNQAKTDVLLIRKNRPDWQAGKWNAIGGHIEPGESPRNAMRREFREESGLEVYSWNDLCALRGEGFVVHFFYAENVDIRDSCSMTDELVAAFPVGAVTCFSYPTLPNVPWLLAMALSLDRGERANWFYVQENGCLPPTEDLLPALA